MKHCAVVEIDFYGVVNIAVAAGKNLSGLRTGLRYISLGELLCGKSFAADHETDFPVIQAIDRGHKVEAGNVNIGCGNMIPAAEVPRGEELCVRFPDIIGITCCGSERGCILSLRKGLNLFTCRITECAAVEESGCYNRGKVELLNGMLGVVNGGILLVCRELNVANAEALSVCCLLYTSPSPRD